MGAKSVRKGKVGEREAVKWLASHGVYCERNARNGKHEPDIIISGKLIVEVKYGVGGFDLGTKLLYDACNQARDYAQKHCMDWVVAWKPPRMKWRITFEHDGLVMTAYGGNAIRVIQKKLQDA